MVRLILILPRFEQIRISMVDVPERRQFDQESGVGRSLSTVEANQADETCDALKMQCQFPCCRVVCEEGFEVLVRIQKCGQCKSQGAPARMSEWC